MQKKSAEREEQAYFVVRLKRITNGENEGFT
jgi:hypothetical protein